MCDLVQVKVFEAVQLSVAVGSVHVAVPLHEPESFITVILAGHPVITGFWLSTTVTVKLTVLVFPAASVAE